MKNKKELFLPFLLTAIVIAVDQISKFLVVKYMEPYSIFRSFLGDFLNLRLVYNLGAAFSFGADLGELSRRLFLGALPVIFLIILIVFYFKSDEFTKLQRWFVCGIIGGGFGNLLDRFFRSEGVVDFIDVKFFGIFGMERWPTFNAADAFIVCSGIGLAITFIIQNIQQRKTSTEQNTNEKRQ
ncbi:signal peptidase II [Treponema pedis]|uniref:Lipoprotein signal peptidase n=1 Tax=Treponema pedis TaxID=409322 RepID=A0A7S6WMU9_9SPIR|nr:signal peptidase II [Treponema pedis]QOW60070.1 signal peptidase II [Treponema pedis]